MKQVNATWTCTCGSVPGSSESYKCDVCMRPLHSKCYILVTLRQGGALVDLYKRLAHVGARVIPTKNPPTYIAVDFGYTRDGWFLCDDCWDDL